MKKRNVLLRFVIGKKVVGRLVRREDKMIGNRIFKVAQEPKAAHENSMSH
jgi:hypothetical protein